MEDTPSFSGNCSSSGYSSSSTSEFYQSTPSTPISRKNKRSYSSSTTTSLAENLNQLDISNNKKIAKLSTSTPTTPIKRPPPAYLTNTSVLSPIKESREILYNVIPSIRLTPKKRRLCNVEKTPNDLLMEFINNKVIMGVVFKHLSNGDLYRFSMVCKTFRDAVFNDYKANQRYILYKEIFKVNKENYVITPPGSPEHDDTLERLKNSGASDIFCEFVSVGQTLKEDEGLDKCPKCGHPSIIINNLGQCQNKFCRNIHCKLCFSCSNDPETFEDSCNNSFLDRSKLGDLSNNKVLGDSGFHSPSNNNTPLLSRSPSTALVKRKLFSHKENFLFHSRVEEEKKENKKKLLRRQKRATVIPVIKGEGNSVSIDSPSPSPSPPPKIQPIGSKQSKKRLRRLVF